MGQTGSVGKYNKEGLSTPETRIGSGAQRQGFDTGETPYTEEGGGYTHMDEEGFDSKKPDNEITFTKEEGEADYHISRAVDAAEEAQQERDFMDPSLSSEDLDKKYGSNNDGPQGDTTEEKLADDGPSDGNVNSNNINQQKVERIFTVIGNPEFAPGEEPNQGGMVDPELLQAIQSSQTQVKTVDEIGARSDNFEDLGRMARENIESGGPTIIDSQ
nr:hypothetical protein 4 [Desulfobulbaceae bacterium]